MRIIIKVFITFLLSFWVLAHIQCSSPSRKDKRQEEIKQDIAADKEQLTKDLRALRDDLNNQITHINEKLKDASVDSKIRLERAKQNFLKQRDEVDRELRDVGQSTRETFSNIKTSARKGYEDIRDGFKKAGDDISDIFDKEKS